MPPLVSLLIITYEQAGFIREAIESAVRQDYENLEIIVADDGSSDGTADIAAEYAARHPGRVKAIVGGPHLGITGNSNRGLRACAGELFAWMGGDDVLYPGKISAQVAWFGDDERRVLCGHDIDLYDADAQRMIGHAYDRQRLRNGSGAARVVTDGGPFNAISIMIRTSALPPGGFDERLPIVSDWKLYIDVLAGGGAYGYVDGVYARYSRHRRNVTQSDPAPRFADVFLTLELVESSYPHLRKAVRVARARYHYVKAKWHLARGELRAARRLVRMAFWPPRALGWRAYAVLAGTFSRRLGAAITRRSMPF